MKNSALGLPEEYYVNPRPHYAPAAPTDVPLLFYCAHESMFEQQGRRLGKLCSLISGETFHHLIVNSPIYDANWRSVITRTTNTPGNTLKFLDVISYLEAGATNDWDWAVDSPPPDAP